MATAHELFDRFLTERGISGDEAARALSVSKSTISQLRHGGRVPAALLQQMIARWTRGHVPTSAWLSEEDKAALASVVPAVRRAAQSMAVAS